MENASVVRVETSQSHLTLGNARGATCATMASLPDELFLDIVSLIAHDPNYWPTFANLRNQTSWLSATHVSRGWRQFLLGTSVLWTDIDIINTPHSAIDMFLRRSKTALLDVYAEEPVIAFIRAQWRAYADDGHLAHNISALLPYIQRIQRLHGYFHSPGAMQMIHTLLVELPHMGSLDVLMLHANSLGHVVFSRVELGNLSRLRELDLMNVSFPWVRNTHSGLVRLVLEDLDSECCPSVGELFSTLAASPQLEELYLGRSSLAFAGHEVEVLHTIRLSCLKILSVESTNTVQSIHIMKHLCIPDTTRLLIRWECRIPEHFLAAKAFFSSEGRQVMPMLSHIRGMKVDVLPGHLIIETKGYPCTGHYGRDHSIFSLRLQYQHAFESTWEDLLRDFNDTLLAIGNQLIKRFEFALHVPTIPRVLFESILSTQPAVQALVFKICSGARYVQQLKDISRALGEEAMCPSLQSLSIHKQFNEVHGGDAQEFGEALVDMLRTREAAGNAILSLHVFLCPCSLASLKLLHTKLQEVVRDVSVSRGDITLTVA